MATTSFDNSSNNRKKYDFTFLIRHPKLLNHAIDALSDPIFYNKDKKALIQVGSNGCEITVYNINVETENRVIGCLLLKATCLEDFQCTKPLKKSVSLRDLSRVFRDADKYQHESVVIFVEEGSDILSFQWESSTLDFSLGYAVNVDLHDVKTEHKNFPDISYVFEAATPSKDLRAMMTKLQETRIFKKAELVHVHLRPATVQLMVDDTVSMRLEEQEKYEVWMEWKFWDSLEKAAQIADNCRVYLLNEPPKNIMLRFDIQQLGDLLFVNEANFLDVPDLPCIGHFPSLN